MAPRRRPGAEHGSPRGRRRADRVGDAQPLTVVDTRALRGRSSAPVRDRVAIVGLGETEYRPWGGITDRSEFQLACEAILAAAADAGLPPHDLDGFASYANDRNDAPRLAAALGCAELRFSGLVWGGGGGRGCPPRAPPAHPTPAPAARPGAVARAVLPGAY